MDGEREALRRLLEALGEGERTDALLAELEEAGSLGALLESPAELLAQRCSLSGEAADLLRAVPWLARRCELERLGEAPRVATLSGAETFLRALYLGARREEMFLLGLDGEMRVMDCALLESGSLRETPIYLRRIMQRLIRVRPAALILCHNHPGRGAGFSYGDVEATRSLLTALREVRVPLVDHVLLSGGVAVSMRARDFIPEADWAAAGEAVPTARWLTGG